LGKLLSGAHEDVSDHNGDQEKQLRRAQRSRPAKDATFAFHQLIPRYFASEVSGKRNVCPFGSAIWSCLSAVKTCFGQSTFV
jgi:hypothetical protein